MGFMYFKHYWHCRKIPGALPEYLYDYAIHKNGPSYEPVWRSVEMIVNITVGPIKLSINKKVRGKYTLHVI